MTQRFKLSGLSTDNDTNMQMVFAAQQERDERMCARSQLPPLQPRKMSPRLRISLHNEEPHIQPHGQKQNDHDGIPYRIRQNGS